MNTWRNNNMSPNKDDTKSLMSNASNMSDVSIDPIIRRKAEKILQTYRDEDDVYGRLDIIKEEEENSKFNAKTAAAYKLTANGLK